METASIALTINGGPIFGSYTGTFEVSQTDGDRIIAYAMALHGTDEQGDPRTPQQVVDQLAEDFLKTLLAKVQRHEREAAAQAAAAGVAAIPYTKIVA